MPSHSPTSETLTLDYADGWAAINRLVRQGQSWSGREMDCAYWNAGDGSFVDVSNTLGLALKGDGRAFAQVDWDGDGDLDLWIANRTAPQLQLMRNNSNTDTSLRLKLEGAGHNTQAVGARVKVTAGGREFIQERRVGSGYLSQSSAWLHFGVGAASSIDEVQVRWPDGSLQDFQGLAVSGQYALRQGSTEAQSLQSEPRRVELSPSTPKARRAPSNSKITITRRLPLPVLEARSFDGAALSTRGARPKLVNFWASWCPSCMRELKEWGSASEGLAGLDLDVISLSVDEDPDTALETWRRLGLPFDAGLAPDSWIAIFDLLQRLAIDRQREMAVPTSFLLDEAGSIAVIYRGPVDAGVIASDLAALAKQPPAFSGLPFAGRHLGAAKALPLFEIIRRLLDQEQPEHALFYIEEACKQLGTPESRPADGARLSDALTRTGMYFLTQGDFEQSTRAFDRAIAYTPTDSLAWYGRARLCASQLDHEGAERALEQTISLDSSFAPAWELLGTIRFLNQDLGGARKALQSALEIDTMMPKAWSTLGVVELSSEQFAAGLRAFEMAVQLMPNSPDGWTGLGICQIQTGQPQEGIRSLEKALEIDPQNARALQLMQQLGR